MLTVGYKILVVKDFNTVGCVWTCSQVRMASLCFCLVFGAQLGCLDNNHKILVVKDFNNVWVCLDLSSSWNDFECFA